MKEVLLLGYSDQGSWRIHPGGAGATKDTPWSPTVPPATYNLLPTFLFVESGQNPADLGTWVTQPIGSAPWDNRG